MKPTHTIPFKETRRHGTQDFPCAFYQIDNTYLPPSVTFQVKHHWHEELEIVHFKKGIFQFECNMQKYEIEKEAICFIGSGDLHFIASQGNFEEEALVFSPAMLSFSDGDPIQQQILSPLNEHAISLPPVIDSAHPCFPAIRKAFSGILASFEYSPSQGELRDQHFIRTLSDFLLLKSALYYMLSILKQENLLAAPDPLSEPDRRITVIKQALSYMKEHSSEKIYIRDIADQVNMNEQYFCRFFKKIIGKPPIEYLSEIRIKHACHLLSSTDQPVMEICLECGFNNLGNFMHAFRKSCGCTPLQYRKSK